MRKKYRGLKVNIQQDVVNKILELTNLKVYQDVSEVLYQDNPVIIYSLEFNHTAYFDDLEAFAEVIYKLKNCKRL
jgi:hypothetical protein